MVMLDTNVLSELMKAGTDAAVAHWLARQPTEEVFTATVCRMEILLGLCLLPAGRRRAELEAAAAAMFAEDFAGRLLPFDAAAAAEYAGIVAARRRAGRPVSTIDAMVAAVARSRGASVATRNVRDVEGCGVAVIDPWSS